MHMGNLRKLLGHKWTSWFVLVMIASSFLLAGSNLISVQRLNSLSGLTWTELLANTFAHPALQPGAWGWERYLAALKMRVAFLYLWMAATFIACYIISKRLNGEDASPVEPHDEPQATQQRSRAVAGRLRRTE